jgi:sulfur carrier protein ThiS
MPASTRSGNPAKRATTRKAAPRATAARPSGPSSVADFKRGVQGELIELPSGKSAEIRRVPLPQLLAEGLLGDSLAAYAQQAVDAGQGMKPDDLKEMAKDPNKIIEALDAYDRLAAKCFVKPQVIYCKVDGVVIPEAQRDPEALYSDELDLEDKIFVFQVVAGGTTDLERFRKEFAASVAGVSAGPGVQVPTE